ncbi:MAG TPA: Asp-tRNA(Asn)/Glu-tRNA(Gln) amidotransferase subunit GatC [Saprospiraceae bacterium]|nr:Asp-tRNA(Asn)/Glu-tRNA(Gln) amidotransferase subunit GatC [Saprospiraceae bacterium]HRG21341.1 Asp-tRNA(Asn)/Glu-tRNA(Gln) amidotransferase subunit GatC [Saprospiraceae bacterium]HRG66347.1 Asp-tRNA(Asn)/Glu-tRNA(Gln) amidotransferase subunit GatC [Saprospiraceae bacterium]
MYKKNRISPFFYTFGEVYPHHIEINNMVVDDHLILKLQKLAKLDLDSVERESMKQELEKIIGMFDKISEVDTDGLEALVYMSDSQDKLRDDEVHEGLSLSTLARLAPSMEQNYVAVPKVIET